MKYHKLLPFLIAVFLSAVTFTSPVCSETLSVPPIKNIYQPVITEPTSALADSIPLTKNQVRLYIKTRITTARLQNKMKANATQYDDVIKAFYKKRKVLLKQDGWTVKKFESVEKRIIATTSAMDTADKLAKSKKEHEKEISEIRSNDYFSEEQKAQMIKMKKKLREQERLKFVNPTKPDWPAVKPYRDKLKQLTGWIAGNISNPPELD